MNCDMPTIETTPLPAPFTNSEHLRPAPGNRRFPDRGTELVRRLRPLRDCFAVPLGLAALVIALFLATAIPADALELRTMSGSGEFAGRFQLALSTRMRSPDTLRISHLEVAAGALGGDQDTRAFVSFGPVWTLLSAEESVFVAVGISPTLVGGSSLDGRDLGGNLHFTSSVVAGMRLSRSGDSSIALRLQHMSNAGLSNENPGMDMVGLEFELHFGTDNRD